MCLGVPGRVLAVTLEDGVVRLGRVDFGGVSKDVNLSYVPEAAVGDWVIVHVGFAISRLDERAAARTLALLETLPP
jgi:hydrogenase expression/formation protein HypC